MEKRKRISRPGMEENTMTILTNSGFTSSKMSDHLNVDRLSFLEAIRTGCLLEDTENAPTPKMFDAIYRILRDADSLDLIMQSYQLLIELNKRFPRLYLCKEEPLPSSKDSSKLVMVEEDWLPFNFGVESCREESSKRTSSSVDPLGFHSLVEDVAKSETVNIAVLKNFLLLQYLLTVLEEDFLLRSSAFQENKNWTLLKESLLNILLGSRKIIYKTFIKDCLSTMCTLHRSIVFPKETNDPESLSGENLLESDTPLALALPLPQWKRSICSMLKNFFVMIMELDSSRRLADVEGLTTRADGVRFQVMEIMLDELIYDSDILLPFLQVFDEPKWTLDIIVQFFQKYIPKSSVKTRRSSGTVNVENFEDLLKCLSNNNSTRSIIKKMSTGVVQLLLAFAFKAYLAQSNSKSEGLSDPMEDDSATVEVCRHVVSVFTCLKQADLEMEMLSFSKEALFTAGTILAMA